MLRDGHKLWDTLSFCVCAQTVCLCDWELPEWISSPRLYFFFFFSYKDNFAFLILFTVINSESCKKKKKNKKISLTAGGDNGSPGKRVHQAVKQLCKTKNIA